MLSFSAIKNNDKVGLALFSDKVEKYIPPKKGKKHVLRLITDIVNHDFEKAINVLQLRLQLILQIKYLTKECHFSYFRFY